MKSALVQLYTGFIYEGPALVRAIVRISMDEKLAPKKLTC